MTDRELLQMALDALEHYKSPDSTIKALRARLAQPEPVIYARKEGDLIVVDLPQVPRGSGGISKDEQPEPEPEKSQDKPCVEDDGCPTEKAVLQRFWREHQAQPEQEPVAWGVPNTRPTEKAQFMMLLHSPDGCQYPEQLVPLYTAPPQREWQGLTDEEYEAMAEQYVTNCYFDTLEYAKAIEAKLKEKNT